MGFDGSPKKNRPQEDEFQDAPHQDGQALPRKEIDSPQGFTGAPQTRCQTRPARGWREDGRREEECGKQVASPLGG